MKMGKKDETWLIEERVKRIRSDYDYTDDMLLIGWIWEFLRRSSEYRQQFELINHFVIKNSDKDIVNPESLKHVIWDKERADDAIEAVNIMINFPKCIVRSISGDEKQPSNKECFLEVCYPFKENIYIPKPEKPYSHFGKDLDNRIRGTEPVISRDYAFFKSRVSDWSSEIDSMDTSDIPHLKSWFFDVVHSLLFELALNDPEETIYIGIHKGTKKKDLLRALEKVIDRFTKAPKTKQRDSDKWKYYLIVYDLRTEQPKMSFSKISSLIQQAYPEVKIKKGIMVEGSDYFDARNCNTFYNNAIRLIEGGYKKYLLLSK